MEDRTRIGNKQMNKVMQFVHLMGLMTQQGVQVLMFGKGRGRIDGFQRTLWQVVQLVVEE
jgi:hypothetical protein